MGPESTPTRRSNLSPEPLKTMWNCETPLIEFSKRSGYDFSKFCRKLIAKLSVFDNDAAHPVAEWTSNRRQTAWSRLALLLHVQLRTELSR